MHCDHFIVNKAILLKWQVEQIMNGMKIMCTWAEHLMFPDKIGNFFPTVHVM